MEAGSEIPNLNERQQLEATGEFRQFNKRGELESIGEIRQYDTLETSDGRMYPRQRKSAKKPAPKAEPDDEREVTPPKAELFGIPVWFDRVR